MSRSPATRSSTGPPTPARMCGASCSSGSNQALSPARMSGPDSGRARVIASILGRIRAASRPGDLEPVAVNIEHRAGHHELPAVDAVLAQIVHEDRLVGEGIPVVAMQVVEVEQVLVEEAGRAG